MSITDELRKWAHNELSYKTRFDALIAIADRIDAEHEGELLETGNNILRDVRREWVRLPKDADGDPIHVGDKVTCARSVWQVTGLRLTGLAWGVCCTIFNDHGGSGTNVYPPCDLHRYHAPTVEEVLREMLYKAHIYDEREMELLPDLIADYAKRLTLAESEDA